MLNLRKAGERGHLDHGWLKTYHTFSFASYYDRAHMNFHSLRVINEDIVLPGQGFGTHPHDNMEIITYIVEGALEHKDSMGNGSVIQRGDVQRMSAGTGVMHSEFNPSDDKAVHLLQIWIMPDKIGVKPSYEQTVFTDEEKLNQLRLVASPDGAQGSVRINQNAWVYASLLEAAKTASFAPEPGRYQWLQLIKGALDVNGTKMEAGDGLALADESSLSITANQTAEFLLFDLAEYRRGR